MSASAMLARHLPLGLLVIVAGASAAPSDRNARMQERLEMVSSQIAARDVRDERVLQAMRTVPRHVFVPPSEQRYAYRDTPLPIGQGQTISQPYIVALMTELAQPRATDRVLEVGTGSGYQAAVLAQLVDHVYSIELEPELAKNARRVLTDLGYKNVSLLTGDGYLGWPEHAPFDIVIVTAAPDHIPEPLVEQLKPGGRLIVPVGPAGDTQQLQVLEKRVDGTLSTREIAPVRFVPLRRERN